MTHCNILGRSGLRVHPLCLGMGTLVFGYHWDGGFDIDVARRVFDLYVDRGGNFIDSAPNYEGGLAERLTGAFSEKKRHSLVLSTKYSIAANPNHANAGGNHRKSLMRSVEESLTRLQTDYIDLLYLHAWDFCTPVEEILRAFDDLVSSGKILYVGMSNVPAWEISRMQAISELRGYSNIIGLQIEYNLAQRAAERDLIPMAREMGIGVVPWSPLAGGVLAGKYRAEDLRPAGRKSGSYQSFRHLYLSQTGNLTDRNLQIAAAVKEVAAQENKTPAQIALAWLRHRPVVASTAIGARNVNQLEECLTSLDITLNPEQVAALDRASEIDLGYPHSLLSSSRIMAPQSVPASLPARRGRGV